MKQSTRENLLMRFKRSVTMGCFTLKVYKPRKLHRRVSGYHSKSLEEHQLDTVNTGFNRHNLTRLFSGTFPIHDTFFLGKLL